MNNNCSVCYLDLFNFQVISFEAKMVKKYVSKSFSQKAKIISEYEKTHPLHNENFAKKHNIAVSTLKKMLMQKDEILILVDIVPNNKRKPRDLEFTKKLAIAMKRVHQQRSLRTYSVVTRSQQKNVRETDRYSSDDEQESEPSSVNSSQNVFSAEGANPAPMLVDSSSSVVDVEGEIPASVIDNSNTFETIDNAVALIETQMPIPFIVEKHVSGSLFLQPGNGSINEVFEK